MMHSSQLNEKYSLENMLLDIEKLHMIEVQERQIHRSEGTRKQKDILEALDKISWW